MKENKKYYIIGGSVLLVLVLVFIGFKIANHKYTDQAIVEMPTEAVVTAPVATPAHVVKKQAPKMAYNDALKVYGGGRQIQFDQSCHVALLANKVFANGTTVMLDNRASVARLIKIGDKSYKVAPYSYELAKLSASVLPTTYLVDCDSQQNPVTLTVE